MHSRLPLVFLLKKPIFTDADLYMEYFRNEKQNCYQWLSLGIRLGSLTGNETSFSFYMLLHYLIFFITHMQHFYLNKQKARIYVPYCYQC